MVAQIEKRFDAPGPQPNGMQATLEGLWILDQFTNEVALVSYDGQVLKSFGTASDRGSGITDSGTALWIASTYSREILKVNRGSGATLAAFPTPGASQTGAHGLEWRDGMLWVAVPPSATIYQMDVAHGFVVRHALPAPGNRPHGIAWVDDSLWCVETSHRALYRLNPMDGSVIDQIDIPKEHPEPHGMTYWDGAFWYCDATTRAVCRIRISYSLSIQASLGSSLGHRPGVSDGTHAGSDDTQAARKEAPAS
jgi:streptogramin lyase